MLKNLSNFIQIPTLAYDKINNNLAISFLTKLLEEIGFTVSIEGNSEYHQPTIIAKYNSTNSDAKVVLYGHYDVEKVNEGEKWVSNDPFIMEERNGRLFGRGIADNKGILIARIEAIREMILTKEGIPSILWLIQGEEEVQGKVPFTVFPKAIKSFNANYFVEETGYNQDGVGKLFILPKTIKSEIVDSLNEVLFSGNANVEYRTLNKLFVNSRCPFLNIIPENGYYIGFGPNDEYSNIHIKNESLDKELLLNHIAKFKTFLTWITKEIV